MADAFRFAVGSEGVAALAFDVPDRPVNVLSTAVLEELAAVVETLATRRDVRVLVLLSGKPDNFTAGADLDQIAAVTDADVAESVSRRGQAVFGAWSALPFPTVAAVRGTCMGGGTELALASSAIVASDRPELRIGLPEVALGIVPGWGGCTRLPARVGVTAALELILEARPVSAQRALEIGLVDALLPEAGFLRHLRRYVLELAADTGCPLRCCTVAALASLASPRRASPRRAGGFSPPPATHYPAPLRALEVVRVGVERGLAAGLEAEARAIGDLAPSRVCKSLVHSFRLVEAARKAPGVSGGEPRPVHHVAVLGAGTMGGAIAQLVAERAGPAGAPRRPASGAPGCGARLRRRALRRARPREAVSHRARCAAA